VVVVANKPQAKTNGRVSLQPYFLSGACIPSWRTQEADGELSNVVIGVLMAFMTSR
jgi:hypothetical protein